MLKVLVVLVSVLGLVACSPTQRDGVVDSVGKAVGAPEHPDGAVHKDQDGTPRLDGQPDYKPIEVGTKVGVDAASKSGNPTDLILYAALVIGSAISGWVGGAKREKAKAKKGAKA